MKLAALAFASIVLFSLATTLLRLTARIGVLEDNAQFAMYEASAALQPYIDQAIASKKISPISHKLNELIQPARIAYVELKLKNKLITEGEKRRKARVEFQSDTINQQLYMQYDIEQASSQVWGAFAITWLTQTLEALFISLILIFGFYQLSGLAGRNTLQDEKSKAQLAFYERFGRELAELSTGFINLSVERIDETIDHALERVGTVCQVDSCYLWLFQDAGASQFADVYSWHERTLIMDEDEDKDDALEMIDFERLHWIQMRIQRGIPVKVSSVSQLPADAAAEQQLCEQENIQAFVLLPVRVAGKLRGCLGLIVKHERDHWLDQDIALLRIASDMLSSALQNRNQQQRIDEAGAKLQVISELDELTGIGNRRYFNYQLQRNCRVATRHQQLVTLLLIDVDYFNQYNAKHGHQAGDSVLQSVAQVVDKTFRRADETVARFGGDQFVVLCGADSHPDAIYDQAKKLCANVEALAIPQEVSIDGCITVSVGLACLAISDAEQYKALIEMASKGLDEAKHQGRNCVFVEGENGDEVLAVEAAPIPQLNEAR
jgi:diguanylate cyclase (GGDEF)-like protein